jgi:opacity protein-like surface antigen
MNDYDNGNGLLLYLGAGTAYTYAANSNKSASFTMDTRTLFVSTRISGNLGLAINSGSLAYTSAGLTSMNSEYFRIGNDINELDSGLIGHVQEVIIYNSDKTSIVNDVKSNINTYYSIY